MLSEIQRKLFLETSGNIYDGISLHGSFQTMRPYNNKDYNLSPWNFAYVIEPEKGYFICELTHRMTNNRIYGWDKFGNELPFDVTEKYFRNDLDSLETVKRKDEN